MQCVLVSFQNDIVGIYGHTNLRGFVTDFIFEADEQYKCYVMCTGQWSMILQRDLCKVYETKPLTYITQGAQLQISYWGFAKD